MIYVKSDAVVLKSIRYGETSKIVTLFTGDFGKFSAVVKGARSPKSKMSGVFENMNNLYIIFNKKENRDLQYISKTESVFTYPRIKENLEKLTTAYKILEIINKTIYDYDVNIPAFNLLKQTLHTLDSTNIEPSLIYIFFQIKLSEMLGINILEFKRNFDEAEYVSHIRKGFTNIKFDEQELNFLEIISYKSFKELHNTEYNAEMINNIIHKLDNHFLENSGSSLYLKSSVVKDNLNKRFL